MMQMLGWLVCIPWAFQMAGLGAAEKPWMWAVALVVSSISPMWKSTQ